MVEHCMTIRCEIPGFLQWGDCGFATISIDLGRVKRDAVEAVVRLEVSNYEFRTPCIFYGMDILHFAEGLQRLHDELTDSARLCDWDGETLLCLTVIDPGRGKIAIGGRFVPTLHWNSVRSEDNFIGPPLLGDAAGILVTFEGLVIDQSHLPAIVSQAKRFLADTEIGTESPMDFPAE